MTDASLGGLGEGAAPFQQHLDWLAEQKREFEAHQAAHNNGSDVGSQVNAFAVGSAPDFDFDDEQPVYRSLDIVGDDEQPVYRSLSVLADDELPVYRSLNTALAGTSVDEEPVYRSIDLSKMAVSSSVSSPTSNGPAMNAHDAWAASGRPPLLRRQNAFRVREADPNWLDALNANGNETGR